MVAARDVAENPTRSGPLAPLSPGARGWKGVQATCLRVTRRVQQDNDLASDCCTRQILTSLTSVSANLHGSSVIGTSAISPGSMVRIRLPAGVVEMPLTSLWSTNGGFYIVSHFNAYRIIGRTKQPVLVIGARESDGDSSCCDQGTGTRSSMDVRVNRKRDRLS